MKNWLSSPKSFFLTSVSPVARSTVARNAARRTTVTPRKLGRWWAGVLVREERWGREGRGT